MLFHTAKEFIMPTLTITQRKWLLILHLIFIAIWFGNTVIFLILEHCRIPYNEIKMKFVFYISCIY